MISPTILGALILGIPAIAVAYFLLWYRNRPVFWFALALVAVGLGYLDFSGALDDIANFVLGYELPTEAPSPCARAWSFVPTPAARHRRRRRRFGPSS